MAGLKGQPPNSDTKGCAHGFDAGGCAIDHSSLYGIIYVCQDPETWQLRIQFNLSFLHFTGFFRLQHILSELLNETMPVGLMLIIWRKMLTHLFSTFVSE